MNKKKETLFEKLSYKVSNALGKFFYKLGFNVAKNPKKTVGLTCLTVFICMTGFLNFKQEKDPLKLWVPTDSDFLVNTKFIIDNYEEAVRTQNVLIFSENDVLTPEGIRILGEIDKEILNISAIGENGTDINFRNTCLQIPYIAELTVNEESEEGKSDQDKRLRDVFESFSKFEIENYCKLVNSLKRGCARENFLELWKSNYEKVKNISKLEIIDKMNKTYINPETGHEARFDDILGGITRNEDGKIISAKSILSSWTIHIKFSDVKLEKLGNTAGTESFATFDSMILEQKFLEKMGQLKKDLETENITIFYAASRSYGDISSKTLFQDIDKIVFGTFLMILYMIIVLSRWSWVEMKVQLSCFGLLNVVFGFLAGCGISSTCFAYSPVHTSLFFIVLGLGVDDIFVIMATLKKVNEEYIGKTGLSERIGKTLEKSGTSITITTITDIIAFFVGATTVLPSLKSFCIFAGIAIFMNYVFVCTFFVACLTFDERRVLQKKNGCIPCVAHKESKICWEPKFFPRFMHALYSLIFTKTGKTATILLAIALSAFSIERIFHLKQKSDPMWFIPENQQFYQYIMKYREFYPQRSSEAAIFFGSLNYTSELPKLITLSKELKNQTHILGHVTSWTDAFEDFMNAVYDIDVEKTILTQDQFEIYISYFLFSAAGGQYQKDFRFNKPLVCGKPASNVKISSINFIYHKFYDREEYLPAKSQVEKLLANANLHAQPGQKYFVWSKIFANWITDEIIDEEIFRNISLALIGVFICTFLMIVNLQVCAFIFTCVFMSLVSVGGFMQVLGLTLDLITCISLQLSVGLCIDCAAHIGHTFLTISEGDGNYRALQTVKIIGAAVWQGGGSTMLAVSTMFFSEAYIFQTFFKVFTIVVIFAIFYGTFFLPVILSIFPPKPYKKRTARHEPREENELKNLKPIEKSDLIRKKENPHFECDSKEDDKLSSNYET